MGGGASAAPAASRAVRPCPRQRCPASRSPGGGGVRRCCPGGDLPQRRGPPVSLGLDRGRSGRSVSRSRRPRRGWPGGVAVLRGTACATSSMRSATSPITGRCRRALPADFPPAWTVYYWADKRRADGSAERMHDDLRGRIRDAAGRKTAPTAAIVDSQSVKRSEIVARTARTFAALLVLAAALAARGRLRRGRGRCGGCSPQARRPSGR